MKIDLFYKGTRVVTCLDERKYEDEDVIVVTPEVKEKYQRILFSSTGYENKSKEIEKLMDNKI